MATQSRTIPLTAGLAAMLALAPTVHAIGFGDMFNPGRWFGGNDDDYYYEDGPWGGPYGGGPYGPYGAPYGGYGAPGYGPYGGAPGYGYPPAPGYGAPAYAAPVAPAAPAAPATGSDSAKDQEIEALKRRIEQLESRQPAPVPAPPAAGGADTGWPSAPAFRPMDQY